jgi:hypothetical protein
VHGATGVFLTSKYEIQNASVLLFISGLLEIISFVLSTRQHQKLAFTIENLEAVTE